MPFNINDTKRGIILRFFRSVESTSFCSIQRSDESNVLTDAIIDVSMHSKPGESWHVRHEEPEIRRAEA